ncbi:MAG: RidA family protein, partial [Deltaproteobacteria bacterium]|nr:RidA family protein [Deltaproteobacteria bacterium]
HVLAVVAAAGGQPEHIMSMTIFVTDIDAYRRDYKRLGPVWRERLGKHYPAMALIGVSELVEPRAKVEIQAVAALPEESS